MYAFGYTYMRTMYQKKNNSTLAEIPSFLQHRTMGEKSNDLIDVTMGCYDGDFYVLLPFHTCSEFAVEKKIPACIGTVA